MTELAIYAVGPHNSRGRRFKEAPPVGRSELQRDRDRIIHSTAFRRLEYKTQVFVNHEGDLFRTRLTHSLEVAQIARSVARNLRLNEDLTEAIALAHDLGHTPFGHAGQDALHARMKPYGGFEHNLQSLRVVDLLEQRYAAFDGLNLCFETREGILKHCSINNAKRLGTIGERFIKKLRPSLEAQLANIADEIAYNNHDVDDGLRSGLLTIEQLSGVKIFSRHMKKVQREYPKIDTRRLVHETVRRMISTLVTDLTENSGKQIHRYRPSSLDAVRHLPPLINFSPAIAREQKELKQFLQLHLYQHYQVVRMTAKMQRIVTDLFCAYLSTPRLLPEQYEASLQVDAPRTIADYIAGMTDRYAIREYHKLFSVNKI